MGDSEPGMENSSVPSHIRELFAEESSEKRKEVASVWALLKSVGERHEQTFDAEGVKRKLKEEIDPDGEAEGASPSKTREQRPVRRRKGRAGRDSKKRWFGIVQVAVLVLALTAAGLGTWLTRPVVLSVEKGSQMTETLPDGSTVELNGGSTLSYQRGLEGLLFGSADTFRVELEGEAFFSAETAERAFVVSTPNAQVMVEGTEFTVATYSGSNPVITRVTLRSGRLQFAAADRPGQSVTLAKKGSQSQLRGTSGSPTPPEQKGLDYAEAWREGGFAVQEADLSVTLRKLERHYDTSIRLANEKEETRPMTLLYGPGVDLDEILSDICLVQGLSYQTTSQGYVLTSSSKQSKTKTK